MLSLAPYVRYQFRVIAVNEVGRSHASRPSDHHETPPAGKDGLFVFEHISLKKKDQTCNVGF